MDPLIVSLLTILAVVTIVSVAAVLISHLALKDVDSMHRAAVLESVAAVVRSIRGKR